MVRVPRIGLQLNHRFSDEGGSSIAECEQPPGDLEGRCAVVTGAARGIGLAVAQHLLWAKASVVAVDQHEQALKEHFDGQPGCEWIAHDLAADDEHSDDGTVTNGAALAGRVLDAAEARGLGPPSLVVNNAAASTPHGFLDLHAPDYDSVQRVIVRSPLHLTQRLMQHFLQARERNPVTTPQTAAVLWVSSIHATLPARRPHYSSGKAAVDMLVRELAYELGPRGIRVNAISPGWVRTDPDPKSPEQRAKERALVPRIPLRRPGKPEDVARLALVLLSDDWAGYLTGVNVPADGGLSVDTWVPPPDKGWGADD